MTLAFYRQLAQMLAQEPVVLATVIRVRGSVPREVGAKMIVSANQTWGTIGGGAGEAKVIQQSRTVLQTGEKQAVEIDLTGHVDRKISIDRETQGICGGKMQVWLERWAGEGAIALVRQILDQLQTGQSVILTTFLETAGSPQLLESVPDPIPANAFVETLQPPPTLLIVGAGHCGMQLAKIAHLIGFEIVVQDDRPEWANPQFYPQAVQVLTQPIAAAIAQLQTYTHLFAALVTRSYQHDLAALTALLQRTHPCEYIGMIGSEKRVHQVYQTLINTGISPEQLRPIHAPIGLDIGALTPEEIAVSIAAELILVRRGGTGHPLSQSLRQRLGGSAIENFLDG